MVAVERILQYCRIPSEAPLVLQNKNPEIEKGWPIQGSISVEHLQVSFPFTAEQVLTFDILVSLICGEMYS